MEFTLLDTSLDLNTTTSLPLLDELPLEQHEVLQDNFIGLGGNMPPNDEAADLAEEVKRLSGENKKLREMLSVMCDNYNTLRNQLMSKLLHNNGTTGTRKRKVESTSTNNNNNILDAHFHGVSSELSDEDSSCKKSRVDHDHIQPKNNATLYVRTTKGSDTSPIVNDGYEWRKYGQKVTRDNPYPRAYFKCAFAPTCPVKKKVQRSVDDKSIIVATYEGEHNHSKVLEAGLGSALNLISTDQPKTLSVNGNGTSSTSTAIAHNHKQPEFHKLLIDQIASSLTKDTNFKAALAAALSQKTTLPHNQTNIG